MRCIVYIALTVLATGCNRPSASAPPNEAEPQVRTNIAKDCNVLNARGAKDDIQNAERLIAAYQSMTNVSYEWVERDVEKERANLALFRAQFEKWDSHVKKYGHIHEWPKHTENGNSEQAVGGDSVKAADALH